MATPQQVVENFVEAFVAAWPSRDVATVADFFTDNASYHNGPLAPVHGRVAIKAALADFMAYGGEVRVDMRNLLANDRVVMTERVDHFVLNGTRLSLPVMGTFEVIDDKIAAWRDYFDLGAFLSLMEAAR